MGLAGWPGTTKLSAVHYRWLDTDQGPNRERLGTVRDAADLQLRLALLRIGDVAEFAVSRPGGAVTVRAAMAEREPAARSK
jgi:hypothetical protein